MQGQGGGELSDLTTIIYSGTFSHLAVTLIQSHSDLVLVFRDVINEQVGDCAKGCQWERGGRGWLTLGLGVKILEPLVYPATDYHVKGVK